MAHPGPHVRSKSRGERESLGPSVSHGLIMGEYKTKELEFKTWKERKTSSPKIQLTKSPKICENER